MWNEFYSSNKFGIWIECTKCKRWRKVFEFEEPHEVPNDWICTMSISKDEGKSLTCDDPEQDWDENYFEHYPGSIVWAKLDGYPWWPGIVDENPDVEEYFWENSLGNKYYNVTFLDDHVTHAWIPSSAILPFLKPPKRSKLHWKKYFSLIDQAEKRAKQAMGMSIKERLEKFSFANLYKGKWPLAVNYENMQDTKDLDITDILLQEVEEISSLDSFDLLDENEFDRFIDLNKYDLTSTQNETISNVEKTQDSNIKSNVDKVHPSNSLVSNKLLKKLKNSKKTNLCNIKGNKNKNLKPDTTETSKKLACNKSQNRNINSNQLVPENTNKSMISKNDVECHEKFPEFAVTVDHSPIVLKGSIENTRMEKTKSPVQNNSQEKQSFDVIVDENIVPKLEDIEISETSVDLNHFENNECNEKLDNANQGEMLFSNNNTYKENYSDVGTKKNIELKLKNKKNPENLEKNKTHEIKPHGNKTSKSQKTMKPITSSNKISREKTGEPKLNAVMIQRKVTNIARNKNMKKANNSNTKKLKQPEISEIGKVNKKSIVNDLVISEETENKNSYSNSKLSNSSKDVKTKNKNLLSSKMKPVFKRPLKKSNQQSDTQIFKPDSTTDDKANQGGKLIPIETVVKENSTQQHSTLGSNSLNENNNESSSKLYNASEEFFDVLLSDNEQ